MKNNTVKLMILLFLFCSCTNKPEKSKKEENEISTNTKSWVQFPFVTIDSYGIKDDTFYLNLIDSTAFLNTTYVMQYSTIHILQAEPHLQEYDIIQITINLPNREGEPVSYELTPEDYNYIAEYFSDNYYRTFIREYINLNYEVKDSYNQEMTTLIDRVNMIFAHEIDKNYPDLFPNNSTWYGYDSFDIFKLYFVECIKGKEDVGHELINSINNKTNYLKEEDILKLQSLIEKYKSIFEEN